MIRWRVAYRPPVLAVVIGQACAQFLFAPLIATAAPPGALDPADRTQRLLLISELKRHALWRAIEQDATARGRLDVVDRSNAAIESAPALSRVRIPRNARPASITSAPGNVRLNNPSGDAAGTGQSEPSVAQLGSNILAVWNDGQGFVTPGDVLGYGYSTDGGATFLDGGSPPHPAGFASWQWLGDGKVTVNEATGDFYFCSLADPTGSGFSNAIGVARARFSSGTLQWMSVTATRVTSVSTLLDKPRIAADSASGRVFVASMVSISGSDSIEFQRSLDSGVTWQSPIVLSSVADAGLVSGPRLAIGPLGQVYSTWYAFGTASYEDFARFRTSTDGGATWGPQVTAASFISNFGTGAPGSNRVAGITYPTIDVDRTTGPHRGRIYLAWNECYNHLDEFFPVPVSGNTLFETESNATPATANPFTLGTHAALSGVMSSGSDLDYYSFALSAGHSIVVWCDSVAPAPTAAYTVRLLAPIPQSTQRLCLSGDLSIASSDGFHPSYFTFTAPVSGTYFLRMSAAAGASGAQSYRVRVVEGHHGTERGRDQRDIFTSTSDNGTTWSSPVRVNDDPAGFDNYLPEVDTYGTRANVYTGRVLPDGGPIDPNAGLTTAASNFTTSLSNIAPNMGDFTSLVRDGSTMRAAWSDGRGADVDVYTATLAIAPVVLSFPADTTVIHGSVLSTSWRIRNPNALFAAHWMAKATDDRGWLPGTPIAVNVPAATDTTITVTYMVPDSAAPGVTHVCLELDSLTTPDVRLCYGLTVTASSCQVSYVWHRGPPIEIVRPLAWWPQGDVFGKIRLRPGDVIGFSILARDLDYLVQTCTDCRGHTRTKAWGPYGDVVQYNWYMPPTSPGTLIQSATDVTANSAILYRLPLCGWAPSVTRIAEINLDIFNDGLNEHPKADDPFFGTTHITLVMNPMCGPKSNEAGYIEIQIFYDLGSTGQGATPTEGGDGTCIPQPPQWQVGARLTAAAVDTSRIPDLCPRYLTLLSAQTTDADTVTLTCHEENGVCSDIVDVVPTNDPVEHTWTRTFGVGLFVLGNTGPTVGLWRSSSTVATVQDDVVDSHTQFNDTPVLSYMTLPSTCKPLAFVAVGNAYSNLDHGYRFSDDDAAATRAMGRYRDAGYRVVVNRYATCAAIDSALHDPCLQVLWMADHGSPGFVGCYPPGSHESMSDYFIKLAFDCRYGLPGGGYVTGPHPFLREIVAIGCDTRSRKWNESMLCGKVYDFDTDLLDGYLGSLFGRSGLDWEEGWHEPVDAHDYSLP